MRNLFKLSAKLLNEPNRTPTALKPQPMKRLSDLLPFDLDG